MNVGGSLSAAAATTTPGFTMPAARAEERVPVSERLVLPQSVLEQAPAAAGGHKAAPVMIAGKHRNDKHQHKYIGTWVCRE
jgi:hypothetical protein